MEDGSDTVNIVCITVSGVHLYSFRFVPAQSGGLYRKLEIFAATVIGRIFSFILCIYVYTVTFMEQEINNRSDFTFALRDIGCCREICFRDFYVCILIYNKCYRDYDGHMGFDCKAVERGCD